MFGFPAVSKADNFRLAQNLLQTVTLSIRYKEPAQISSFTSELIAKVVPFLPVVRQLQKAVATVQSSSEIDDTLSGLEKNPDSLQFSLADNTKVLVIAGEAITMTFVGQVYTYFAEARTEFSKIVEAIQPILDIKSYTRVAIRKINVINCQPEHLNESEEPWLTVMKQVFAPSLIGHVTQSPAHSKLTSSVVNSRFQSGSNYLTLIYGLLPKQIEPGVRQAVLDIDLASINGFSSLNEVEAKLLEINNEIYNIFVWSIDSELIEAIKQ